MPIENNPAPAEIKNPASVAPAAIKLGSTETSAGIQPETAAIKQKRRKKPEIMACKYCGENVKNKEFFAHLWSKHPDIAREQRDRATQKHAENARNKNDVPPAKELVNEPLKEKTKAPPATGIKDIGDLRSRMVPLRLYSDTVYLDTSVLIFYDITRLKDPNYRRTVAEWLTEVVTLFYHEHRADFGLENLFAQAPQQVQSQEIEK